jgi:mono/diheme cytochrome c family protein
METGIRHTHLLSVILFLFIYVVKTFLLLTDKNEGLANFTKKVKVPEMIISTLFLGTGIYMLTQIPEIKTLLIVKIIAVFVSIPLAIIGFKKQNKVLAVISLLLIISAYGLAEMSKKQKSKAMDAITTSTVSGKELFEASCVACHGSDGKLGKLDATDLSMSTLDVPSRIDIIKNGKNAMTPFSGALNDEQIVAVAEYIETLRSK